MPRRLAPENSKKDIWGLSKLLQNRAAVEKAIGQPADITWAHAIKASQVNLAVTDYLHIYTNL